jgi:NAD(P)-dependent dehydrogenase (short-subunit alcohol dehydrogenase family)
MGVLAGKRAIITGAGSGIGRASALLFAAEGASVLVVDKEPDRVQETATQVKAAGGKALVMATDAGNETNVVAMVARAQRELGGLVPLFEQPVELWQEILRVNLIGPFLAVKHAGQAMAKQGSGSIICTASVAGLRANAGGHPYSASKAGVISLVQTSANSLVGTGVRINAICPGLIETGMTKPFFDMAKAAGSLERVGQLNPQLRAGEPREIATMAVFLASDAASYVNGQAFVVDGGLSSSHPFTKRLP